MSVGDRIVAQVPKSIENVAAYLGSLRCGAVWVTLNTAYTPAEVAFFIDDAEPTLFLCATATALPTIDDAVLVRHLDADGTGSMADIVNAAAHDDVTAEMADDAPAAMLYTSGTTGRSKGAVLTHGGLAANGEALRTTWHFDERDVVLHTLPIFHVHGLFVALSCSMLSGSSTILLPRFDVDSVLSSLGDATVLMGVPTHYTRLMADPRFGADSCGSIRLFTSGSAPMTAIVHREFEARTGLRIVERYGMTEAGIITSNPYDGEQIAGTVGYPIGDCTLRVRTADGQPAAVDETGIVEIRSSSLFAGYWRQGDKTAESHTDDGWFITGDVGSVDGTGRVTLEGRTGDMIISGGLNVYPKEIEMVLDAAPGIDETAVVGLPHPDFGEGIAAFVVADHDAGADAIDLDALDALVRSQLAGFKAPKAWFVVDALPRNAMGKVQKNLLRADNQAYFSG